MRANYLARPPLVVAYALAGDLNIDLTREPLGTDRDGNAVFLKDIWPSNEEIAELVEATVTRGAFQTKYADVFKGDEKWRAVETTDSETYDWPPTSTYIQNPPYFQGMSRSPGSSPTSRGRASSRCSATWSRPTTSRPPARSSRRRRPASI